LKEDEKDYRDRIRAKILGDLRRLDSAKNFNSKEIGELYDILSKIKGAPKIEEKVLKREDFIMPIESFCNKFSLLIIYYFLFFFQNF